MAGIFNPNFVNWLLEEAANIVIILVKSSILKLLENIINNIYIRSLIGVILAPNVCRPMVTSTITSFYFQFIIVRSIVVVVVK